MSSLVELLAPAIVAVCLVRVILMLRPPPGVKLPPPSKIGLPSGGMASPAAAHAALMGRSARPWWKFW
jgi:hypothetical protein